MWPFRGASCPPQLCHAGTEKTWEKGQELIKCTLFTALSRTFLRGPGFLPCTGEVPRGARPLSSANALQVHLPPAEPWMWGGHKASSSFSAARSDSPGWAPSSAHTCRSTSITPLLPYNVHELITSRASPAPLQGEPRREGKGPPS